jgi:hypothetical protein
VIRKVIAVAACGFTVAACSVSIPSLDFLKSEPPSKAALRFESVPKGAEVKVSGQTCRTPCELTLEVAEVSATFAHKGYHPQTVTVRPETSVFSAPQFVPNPVHADLQPVEASAKRHQAPVATAHPAEPNSAAHAAEPDSAGVTASANAPEATAPANSPGWADVK